jgi:CheY-like chemotaxis protein
LAIPWDQLTSFKAAGVEITLQQPAIKAAMAGLGLDRVKDEQLRSELLRMGSELQLVHGSKVLWIDDKPHNLLGGRRLLRALGVTVVSVISSKAAEQVLASDNDFDLLITDVQRLGDTYKEVGGIDLHEGVNFIVKLRRNSDANIKNMPVIFYAAYDWERLVEFTRPAREVQPEPGISNSVLDFVPKVIRRLAEQRARQIVYSGEKEATGTGPS